MSVCFANERGWILNHSNYLSKTYLDASRPCVCGIYNAFHIVKPFLTERNQKKKRIKLTDDVDSIALKVRELFETFSQTLVTISENCKLTGDNEKAKNVADTVFNMKHPESGFRGGNDDVNCAHVTINCETYFVPPRCEFYCNDVNNISYILGERSFDLILIDPPWRNKHVRRMNSAAPNKGYALMDVNNLAKIPVKNFLSDKGLLVIWCTNSKQQLEALKNTIFPEWGVTFVAIWYWVKVTMSGTPIREFSPIPGKKQPFERIIFARRCAFKVENGIKNPPTEMMVISVPSSVHSHKPPLSEILTEYLPSDATRLELFARYLQPGWTSYGSQVLYLQNTKFFASTFPE